MCSSDLVPILEPLASQLESVEHFVIITDDRSFATTLPSAHNYEDLLEGASDEYSPVKLDENSPAGLCYTSATTGRPKGVIYSHRGVVLHSMMEAQADTIGFRERDVVLPVVPMLHISDDRRVWQECTFLRSASHFNNTHTLSRYPT